ncbi:sensor histidine kinase [Streptomyces sp. NPDC056244]|uniref:sensor histidine kinase n=1 Tax=Streptomyces sp. NPDC056244 TaxID=3345762 RepID=UPI0035DC0A64
MSQLRAPVTRPERREGGRHGRPGTRPLSSAARAKGSGPLPPDARIRPQLLRTAVLPAIVAALSGAAAVVVTLRSTAAEPTAEIWTALVGTALLAFAAIGAAALGAERTAKSIVDRCAALRRTSARGQAELRTVVEQIGRGERVTPRRPQPPPVADAPAGDELDQLAREMGRSHEAAVTAVVQASRISSSVGNEQKVEVFVTLARRLQSLVHREIQIIDELESQVEDPELLKGIFQVDHLATRIRRHAENLAVLGGAVSRRQWTRPIMMTEVLRSAIAEVDQYPRIKLVPPIEGALRGHAVADVIHLLAELIENATQFSSPHTHVLLRTQYVTAGLAVEVEDRGLGMSAGEQERMNALLADPDQVSVARLLHDGRIGLFVVSALARRHGIAVRLQSNIYGGVQAVLVVPQALLGAERTEEPETGQNGQPPVPTEAPVRAPTVVVPVPRQHTPVAREPLYEAPPPPAAQAPAVPPPPPVPPVPHAPAGPAGSAPAPAPVTAKPARPVGPAPLPVRNAQEHRPTPAAARPGVRHGKRRRPTTPPEPADGGAARGGPLTRPQLPKRRCQEHLAPQLRDGPPPPPPSREPELHDPGLMAAFRRGFGLAEAQPLPDDSRQPEQPDMREQPGPQRHDTTPKE